MSGARYLPATRTQARSHGLERLSVRSAEGKELGTLLGFLLDARDRHLCSLVMEVAGPAGSQQVQFPMEPVCLDADAHALRFVGPDVPSMQTFRPDAVPQIEEDDLWVPLFDHAA